MKSSEKTSKNILIAPLNWGLGHATRCIPIIRNLEKQGFKPILASDGAALSLLKKEFPHLTTLELPSYHIQYPKKGKYLKWKFLLNGYKTLFGVWKEKKIVEQWIKEFQISGIISDNRFGVYNTNIKSVYITHQLNVLSGSTTWFSSKIHQFFIKKFDQCWIPDIQNSPNLSGKLGHSKNLNIDSKYIGTLSRFENKSFPKKYDLMVLLSGPEPQRSILETKLISELHYFKGNILFVKGKIESEQKSEQKKNVTFYDFMQSDELEKAIIQSELILSRSGYTTIMDLAKLNKKAFFIPTPGQFEQEYLAKKFQKEGIVPFSTQDTFSISDLEKNQKYKGFTINFHETEWENLFKIFED